MELSELVAKLERGRTESDKLNKEVQVAQENLRVASERFNTSLTNLKALKHDLMSALNVGLLEENPNVRISG